MTGLTCVAVVAPLNPGPGPDDIDEWIAHVGKDYLIWLAESTHHGFLEGTIAGFSDKASMLEYADRLNARINNTA